MQIFTALGINPLKLKSLWHRRSSCRWRVCALSFALVRDIVRYKVIYKGRQGALSLALSQGVSVFAASLVCVCGEAHKSIKAMTTPRRLTTGIELSPCCPGPADMPRWGFISSLAKFSDVAKYGLLVSYALCFWFCRTTHLPIEANEPHRAEPRVEDGGDDGDPGDGHDVAMANGDGGDGVHDMDLAAIVDGVLADLPEPARHHILPELEEHAWPCKLCTLLLQFWRHHGFHAPVYVGWERIIQARMSFDHEAGRSWRLHVEDLPFFINHTYIFVFCNPFRFDINLWFHVGF